VRTIWDAFTFSTRRLPNENFLGSRDPTQEGAPYVWKTWTQVETIVNQLAAGYQALNLLPEVTAEDTVWKFMGIYAKNREEWTLTDLAALRQGGTVIAFYDTLGPAAVEFVIR
jgi:long-chain acyl-CoA synthetase